MISIYFWIDNQLKNQIKLILVILTLITLFFNQTFSFVSNVTFNSSVQNISVTPSDSIPYDSLRIILEVAHDTDQTIREKLSTAEGNDSLFMSYLGEMSVVDRKNRKKVLPIL